MKNKFLATIIVVVWFAIFANYAASQTTIFTYQGSLKDGGVAANGNYDLEFVLFDALSGGTQLGSTIPQNSVAVSNGTFAVTLDFGNQYPGANRFLEIHVRQTGGASFTVLTPRQQIASAPYSVKSLNSENATNSTNSTNALQLGGVAANQYVLTGDTRLSDPRPPTAGSSNYVQNSTTQQAASNFNISGNGTAAGTISGNVITAATQFNIGGNRVLSTGGGSTFVGINAGATSGGGFNTFVGTGSGFSNTTGGNNNFVGVSAGVSNTSGSSNNFFGYSAGVFNTTGGSNSFFGEQTGGSNTSGENNSMFGRVAGFSNTVGTDNSFFGNQSGFSNVSGSRNTTFGAYANVGAGDLQNATAIGANAFVTQNNSLVLGSINGVNGATADTKIGIGTTAPAAKLDVAGTINSATQYNIGGNRVFITGGGGGTIGLNVNTFAGVGAGAVNNAFPDGTLGNGNSFFGGKAGGMNTVGRGNSFFGWLAGLANIDGSNNSFFGAGTASAYSNVLGNSNSFFGNSAGAGLNGVTMSGSSNSFFGASSGVRNAAGNYNTFVGAQAAPMNSTGDGNSFFGHFTGNTNTTGSSNTLIGRAADVGANNLTNTTAIGAFARVDSSNSLVLGGITGVNGGTNTNVGIGTTAPNTALDITGAFSVRGSSAPPVAPAGQGRIYFDGSLGRLRVSQDGGAYGDLIGGAGGLSGSGTTGTVPLWNSSTALGDSAITQSGGNVGIGTTSPGNRFVVNGTVPNSFASNIRTSGIPTASSYGLLVEAGTDVTDSALQINSQSGTPYMRVRGNGYVGIGTTNPLSRLHVSSSSLTGYAAQIESAAEGLLLKAGDLNYALVVKNQSNSNQFTVSTDGSVNIGSGSGTYKLEVANGATRLAGSLNVDGPATFNGTVKVTNLPSGGFVLCVGNDFILNLCGSSLRFKKNLNDFHAGLELVNRLRPVTFDWKKDGTHDVGLIAEEVEAVDPLFATYFDGKLQGVKYDRISVVLINAVKEQQAQIEAQKAEIETLKAAICEIKPTSAVCKK